MPHPDDSARELIAARLMSKTVSTGQCWISTARPDIGGYTRLWIEGVSVKSHRVAWWLATGHWPTEDEHVCHDCPGGDNPACWRNDTPGIHIVRGITYEKRGHLWLGNSIANMHDRHDKGRTATGDRAGPRARPETRPRGESHPYFTRPELIRRGEQNPRSVLTEHTVREIRRRFATEKISKEQLAREYGIAGVNIGKVIRFESWKHVT